jgi:hypothetical protein
MNVKKPPRLVPTEELETYFLSGGIAFTTATPLKLGFGCDENQYKLYSYPAPADDETMAIFCEWHTEDYFEVDTGPHLAIGMRGAVTEDPHRGRGLAIGILAGNADNPDDPDHPFALFRGCPDSPGGPSFFIEDFTKCDGKTPISEWQLSRGQLLPELKGNGIFRIDVHVSRSGVWAGVWRVLENRSAEGGETRSYAFLGQTVCSIEEAGFDGETGPLCCEDPLDRGQGNVFIGTGFSDPETNSWVDNIYIAHWKNPF